MFKRNNDDYIADPWGSSDGVCRSPYEPHVDRLPESVQQILNEDRELESFYCAIDDSVDTNEQAYTRDLRLMQYLKVVCPGLTKSELLTVIKEFPNGLYQFFEYGVMAAGGWCGEDTEYVEKLIRESDYNVAAQDFV